MSVAFKARIVVAEDEEFILNLLRARMDYNLEVQNLRKVAVPQWHTYQVRPMTPDEYRAPNCLC
jgi:hypothetical protein